MVIFSLILLTTSVTRASSSGVFFVQPVFGDLADNILTTLDKFLVPCDEIRLTSQLENGCPGVAHQGENPAFVGSPAASFGGGGKTEFLKDFFGLGKISVGFDKSLFALHHAGAGFVT